MNLGVYHKEAFSLALVCFLPTNKVVFLWSAIPNLK